MNIEQSLLFERGVKNLTKQQKLELDEQLK